VADVLGLPAVEERGRPVDRLADGELILEGGLGGVLLNYFHHVYILRVYWGNCNTYQGRVLTFT